MLTRTVPSPLGALSVVADEAIRELNWWAAPAEDPSPLLDEAVRQLDAYFAGDLRDFDLPVAPKGSRHEKAVWSAMQKIPHGRTGTYGALAQAIGSSPRAVGGACGRNPIPIIIPCHRVIGASGGLGGYSGRGGGNTKRFLLELEGALLPLSGKSAAEA